MNKSESIKEIAVAMCKVSEELKNIHKNAKADVGNYSYNYADLPHILDEVKPILTKNNLVIIQDAFQAEPGYLNIRTMLMHVSGEWIETSVTVPTASNNPNKAQAAGSAITYGRRYGLSSLLNISSEDDNDGNNGDGNTKKPSRLSTDFNDVKEMLSRLDSVERIDKYKEALIAQGLSEKQEAAINGFFEIAYRRVEANK